MNKLQELKRWVDRERDKYPKGMYMAHRFMRDLYAKMHELQSRPVGDVEGYLKDLDYEMAEVRESENESDKIITRFYDVCLRPLMVAALQALKEDKDAEIVLLTKERQSFTKSVLDLTAEVERLKGGNAIQKLRSRLMGMVHENPHITPYDIVKMIDELSIPNPPKQ